MRAGTRCGLRGAAMSITLFHVSDLHFGYEDRAALDWFAAEVARETPAWVLCTGDLTMRGNAREYAAAEQWLAALPAPVSLELGNHDVPYYWYPLARILHPYRRFRALAERIGRRPELPGISVTSLRTVAAFQWRLNLSKGVVHEADLDAAIADLARHADRPLRLVTCHHPLVEAHSDEQASTRHGKAALAALARAGADAVLSGHVHDPFDKRVEIEGRTIRIIGAGTLSQRLRATQPSYNRLDWSPETGLAVTVKVLG